MSSVFYTLAVLACPVGMGLMMFVMMRGRDKNPAGQAQPADRAEIEGLRAEIDALKAQRATEIRYNEP